MKKLLMIVVLVACIAVPAELLARKTTYVITNRRWNYVKLVEMKPRVAEERSTTQPVDIPQVQMRSILKSLNLSKHHLFGDEVTERGIFNDKAINYLAPAICQAFRDSQPNEEVQFSYNVKDPMFILRNDRLTAVTAWVSGNDLYLKFDRLAQKLLGDTDKRGRDSYTLSRAQGIRMTLEIGPGQTMGVVGGKTMIVNLKHNFTPVVATSKTKAATEGATTAAAGEAITAEKTAAPAPVFSDDEITRRLEKLEMLRKRNLISNKEYKKKKEEILKDL